MTQSPNVTSPPKKSSTKPKERNPYTVYALYDPTDGQCKYIGKTTKDVNVRLNQHMNIDKKRAYRARFRSWIVGLVSAGLKPILIVLEEVSAEVTENMEAWWINKYLSHGGSLLNVKLTPNSYWGSDRNKRLMEMDKLRWSTRVHEDETMSTKRVSTHNVEVR